MQKYSRQQAREAEQKARAYQALVAQAEIELAFHSPETVGSWHARWSDRVTAQSHSLTLRDAQGETQVVRISSLDSSWSLFRPEKMPVADGERLRVTGKIPGLRVSGGDRLQVASVSEDAMTVVVPGRAEPATLPVADSPFTALKLENGWVETPGHSVSDSAKVFASVTQMAMDNATLNGLARSGRDVRLYSSLDETRTAEKLARHPSFTVVSEQIKARAGETLLEAGQIICELGNHRPSPQPVNGLLPDMRMTGQIQPPHQGKQRKGPTPAQKHPRLVQMQNAVCMVQNHQHQCHRFDDIPLSG